MPNMVNMLTRMQNNRTSLAPLPLPPFPSEKAEFPKGPEDRRKFEDLDTRNPRKYRVEQARSEG